MELLTEAQVEAAVVNYLLERGWDVTTESDDFADVVARRGTETLVVEAKGHTKSAGAAIDIAYGQLLRRMKSDHEAARYVIAVPETLRWHAERVPVSVRRRIGIELFLVAEDGSVSVV
jgi:Holliday junction resolvase